MKKLLTSFLISAALSLSALAQTPTDPVSGFWDGLNNSGLLSATNYSFSPYFTYAPQVPKGSKYGGGLFAAYNFNNYAGAGFGVDYLGTFSLVSANMTLKYPIKLFTATNGFLSGIYVTPFTIAGIGKGMSGTSSSAIVVSDIGVSLSFAKLWTGELSVGYADGRWDNAGAFSGPRQHFFLTWSKGF